MPDLSQEFTTLPVDALEPHPDNPRRGDVDAIAESIRHNGFFGAVLVQAPRDGRDRHRIIAGEHRWRAAQADAQESVPVLVVDVDDDTALRMLLADNRTADRSGYDFAALAAVLDSLPDLSGTGFSVAALDEAISAASGGPLEPAPSSWKDGAGERVSLTDRFVVPPFTILDARQGYWQDRKREWLSLGIQSELGRAEDLAYGPSLTAITGVGGSSVFDPVLCEIAYRWFSPPGGRILDPFAGGSVRGVVAAALGRRYVGVELRPEQVAANEAQRPPPLAAAPSPSWERETHPVPSWVVGDASALPDVGDDFDLVFSCPPYHDLEVYSDDPNDLSNMPWPDFLVAYSTAIRLAVDRLAVDRFAVWVIGEVRGPDGTSRGLVAETVRAFRDAGASLYNEAILVTAGASTAIRAAKFPAKRKLVRHHQHVLVFVKGDPEAANSACGSLSDLDLGLPDPPGSL